MRKSILAIAAFCTAATLCVQAPQAGQPQTQAKYSVENGVKVYRHPLSAAQIAARNAAQQREYQRDLIQAKAKANAAAKAAQQAQAIAAAKTAYASGFEAGFETGYDKAEAKTKTRNRYNYGRRYTTSVYPLGYYRRAFGRRSFR